MSWTQVSLGSALSSRPAPLSVLACDPYKELLWGGAADGRLVALYASPSAGLEARVRVQAHQRDAPVLHLAPLQRGVLSASTGGLRFHARGGPLLARFATASFCHSLTAATTMGAEAAAGAGFSPSEALLAGFDTGDAMGIERPNLALMDIMTNQLLTQVRDTRRREGQPPHGAGVPPRQAREGERGHCQSL